MVLIIPLITPAIESIASPTLSTIHPTTLTMIG
jgi:hypothetical protein